MTVPITEDVITIREEVRPLTMAVCGGRLAARLVELALVLTRGTVVVVVERVAIVTVAMVTQVAAAAGNDT